MENQARTEGSPTKWVQKLASLGVVTPKHTVESVFHEILKGLENGDVFIEFEEKLKEVDPLPTGSRKISLPMLLAAVTCLGIFIWGVVGLFLSVPPAIQKNNPPPVSNSRSPKIVNEVSGEKQTAQNPGSAKESSSPQAPKSGLTLERNSQLAKVHTLIRQSWNGRVSRQKSLTKANKLLNNIPTKALSATDPTLKDIRKELVALSSSVRDLPVAYWQIVARVADYQYVNNAAEYIANDKGPPECPSIPLGKLSHATISNCRMSLDRKDFDKVTLKHVLITYSGGPLQLHDVTFEDCHFELKFSKAPPVGGQLLAVALLKKTDNVTIITVG